MYVCTISINIRYMYIHVYTLHIKSSILYNYTLYTISILVHYMCMYLYILIPPCKYNTFKNGVYIYLYICTYILPSVSMTSSSFSRNSDLKVWPIFFMAFSMSPTLMRSSPFLSNALKASAAAVVTEGHNTQLKIITLDLNCFIGSELFMICL